MNSQELLRSLIRDHARGFSLDQRFYVSADIYAAEIERFLARQWVNVGHVSEIPQRGDYFVADLLGASVIVTRGSDDALHAHHNVCRHRGARLCEQQKGRTALFRCKYHGWSYRLDGTIASWRHMPESLDHGSFGLRPCGIAVFNGVILVTLDPDNAPDPNEMLEHVAPHWSRYELAGCKVAATRSYPIAANWKLAIENNLECYHCLPSHPQYTAANAFVEADEQVSEAVCARFSEYQSQWKARLAALGVPTGETEITTTRGQICRAGTWPLKPGQLTGSRDGQRLAPLLGHIQSYDESVTTGCFGFLSYIASMCDHALLVTYRPLGPAHTELVIKWLVRAEAREGADYNTDELIWLWDQTSRQDKELIELNAAGVTSRGYLPGPYSNLERRACDFIDRYLSLMADG